MPIYTNNNPLKYTTVTFNEDLDVSVVLRGAGGGGGGHPDDVSKDYKGGDGSSGDAVTGTIKAKAGDVWTVFVGGGGKRGLSWYINGNGGPGGSSKSGYHGGPGGRQGSLGKSAGGGGGGGASVISINSIDRVVAAGGAGGGGEGQFSSGWSGSGHSPAGTTYGAPGETSSSDDGGGGGGGGGGLPGGQGGAFGSGDRGGRGGFAGHSTYNSVAGDMSLSVSAQGGASGGIGGSGDYTNNTDGDDGFFEITGFTLPANRHTGIYTKDGGTWKQPVPSVKYNGQWTQIQEGYVKHDGKWKRVYPPKVSVEINDYDIAESSVGAATQWDNRVLKVEGQTEPPARPTPDDNDPNDFIFIDQYNVQRNTAIVSNTVTITGINIPVTVTATNGAVVSIQGGAFTSSGTISNGQTLAVKFTSPGNYSTKVSTVVTVGAKSSGWNVTTVAAPEVVVQDTTPDDFNFNDVTDAELIQSYTTSAVITGINTSVSATSGSDSVTFSVNNANGPFASTATVSNNDRLYVKSTSAAFYSRTRSFGISVGQRSKTWSITTKAGPKPIARDATWAGPFNAVTSVIYLPLEINATNTSTSAFTSARIIGQPKQGTVTINGTTAVYTPNTNAATPNTLNDTQAQIYVDYWTDLYPNGIKSATAAKNHWSGTGKGEGRYIPQIFTGSDSFTWAITNEYGESNVANCILTFSAPARNVFDDQGPSVVSATPSNGSAGNSSSLTVSINYDEEIYPGTGSITMTGSDGSTAAWTNSTASVSGRFVSFNPAKLKSSTTYTVSVPAGFVKDLAGNNSNAYSWSFTTADTEGPYVVSTNWSGDGWIIITWNEPVTNISGNAEVIGPWYYNGDIEDVNVGHVAGPAPNQTKVPHHTWRYWRGDYYGYGYGSYDGYWYWNNRYYGIFLEEGAVTDLSGNPSRAYNGGYDSGYVASAEPATPVTPVSSTVTVTTTPTSTTTTTNTNTGAETTLVNSSSTYIIDWSALNSVGMYLGDVKDLTIIGASTNVGSNSTITATTDTSTTVKYPVLTGTDPGSTWTSSDGVAIDTGLPDNQVTVGIAPAPNGSLAITTSAVTAATSVFQPTLLNLSANLTFTGGYSCVQDLNIIVNNPVDTAGYSGGKGILSCDFGSFNWF